MRMVSNLIDQGRANVVVRAVSQGFLAPTARYASCGLPLVHIAAGRGEMGLFRCLVEEHGVDAHGIKCREGDTPLLATILQRQERTALYLINETPGLNATHLNARRMNVLVGAATLGLVEVLRALVAKGADVNLVDS